MTSRKKPGVAFWATVVVVVLMGYPLSLGPACWISSRTKTGGAVVSMFYRPMMWGMSRSGRVSNALSWYSDLGSAEGWTWVNNDGWMWVDPDGLGRWLRSPKVRGPFKSNK
jgi:hypothetical protein